MSTASKSFPPDLTEFLLDPSNYPHKTGPVTHLQTHASHVFIASPFVYKFKKPVNFEFLDFSTLEKRKKYCHDEIKLNRRLCSSIYLEVTPLYKTENGWTFERIGNEQPTEYCVKMQELDSQYLLKSLVKTKTADKQHIDRIADTLTPFYMNQQPAPEILQGGTVGRIGFNIDENFRQTEPFLGSTLSHSSFEAITTYSRRFLQVQQKLFQKRIDEGRIVNGHGDLHLEHIHLHPESVCIFDCIEFNERFRHLDVASDLAFLSMDLDFNDYWNLSRYFVLQMSERLGDPDLLRLIDFYKCYRAYVRGKVKSLENQDGEVSTEDREKAFRLARTYFSLAFRYALLGSRPTLLVVMGRVATGKSTVARLLSKKLRLPVYSSDIIRKKDAGVPVDVRSPKEKRHAMYSPETSRKTYAEMTECALADLRNGRSVVLDATFGNPQERKRLLAQTRNVDCKLLFIETGAPDDVRKKRLLERGRLENVISDAREPDRKKLDATYLKPDEIDPGRRILVDTSQEIDNVMNALSKQLLERHLSEEDFN